MIRSLATRQRKSDQNKGMAGSPTTVFTAEFNGRDHFYQEISLKITSAWDEDRADNLEACELVSRFCCLLHRR
jgi:hypothetical protein